MDNSLKLSEKITFWLNCTRAYSLPITILNWLVIFIFALKNHGNAILGILALFGTALVHLATNLIDDYCDYKILIKDKQFFKTAQNCKCQYLKTGQTSPQQIKNIIIALLLIAAIIGLILFILSGYYVAILATLGLLVAISYQKFSLKGFGELVVIFAFGPLLYEGVYYVMTKTFSSEVLILSLSCALFTNTILYTHMLMDFDGDECAHKKTLCRFLKTKENALKALLFFYIGAYLLIGVIAAKTHNHWYLLTYMTIAQVADLYHHLYLFNKDKTAIPKKIYFWHYPLDNWRQISLTKDAPFYFRFFYSRNIMIYFMLLACIAIILE